MASRSRSGKKSGSTLSEDAGDKDLLIAELKYRIAVLEKELRLKQECATFSDITEVKPAKEALKPTQFDLDNFPESAIWVTMDGSIVYVNLEACKSLGYSKEELLSMHIWDIDHDRSPEKFRELWPERKQGRYTKFESTHVARGGRVFPVEVTCCFTRYGDKEYLITFDRDITERKRAEEALREREEKYRFLVENSKDIIWKIDLQGRWTFVSGNVEGVNGYKPGEMVGKPIWDFIAPECHASIREKMLKRMRGEDITPYITWSINKDGCRTPLEVVTTSITDGSGKIVGVQGISRDITLRMRAEEALQESERRYRGIVEDQTELIALLDISGTISFVNDAYCRYFRKKREELVGHTFLTLIAEEDRDAVKASIAGLSQKNPAASIEQRVKLPDGSLAWQEWKNRIVFDTYGRPIGYQSVGRDITERKRAEEALRESEERLRAFLENSKVIGWMKDEDGRYVYLSQNFIRRFNMLSEDWHGRTDFEFWPSEIAEEFRKNDLAVLESGHSFEVIEEAINPDGSKSWWLSSKFPFMDASGKRYIGGLAVDITLRKRAEEAVKFANAYNRSLIEASLDPLVTISPDGKITDVNMATETVTGISRDRLVGTDFSDYFTDPDMARKGYRKVFEEGSVKDYPLELRHRDGGITPVLYNASVYRDESGEIIGVFAAARDITERKRVEEALRESEEKFRVLAETSPAAIFLFQGDKHVYVNPMAETLTGYSREELLARDAWEWIHPEYQKLVKERSRKRQLGEKLPSQYEVKYRSKDGREGWVDFAAGLIEYRGKPTGLAMAFDVSKRKRAEEALKETKAQAELYVDLMGHDINNMNQVSLGFLELAHNIIEMDGKLGEDNIVLLEKAMGALKDSSQLIDSVRKIQREKMGLYEPQVLDVSAVIEDARKHFDRIPGRDVKIAYDQDKHYLVKANSLLKDVFINLIGNAIKHSRGPLAINIHISPVIDNGKMYCRAEVEDNGPGIPDALKSTLFDRLNLTATRAKGKGFGLCLIKMLVDDYGGRFWVEDRVKGDHTKGARFMVMLPVAE